MLVTNVKKIEVHLSQLHNCDLNISFSIPNFPYIYVINCEANNHNTTRHFFASIIQYCNSLKSWQ